MPAQKTPKFCWGCGKPLKPGQKFCTYCGKPVKFEKGTPLPRSAVNQQIPITPKTASFSPTVAANPYGRAPSEDLSTKYHQIIQNPSVAPVAPVVPAASSPSDLKGQNLSRLSEKYSDPYLRQKVDSIENILTGVDIKKNFENIDYKLNSMNVENKLIDIERSITNLSEKSKSNDNILQLQEKLNNVVVKGDLQGIYDRIDTLDISTLSTIDGRLDQIEQKLQSLPTTFDSEQTVNLAKNTITRLNSIEEKLDTNNLETRTRLHRLDEKITEFDRRIERFTDNLELLVPSLVKLTEKINQLQEKVTILSKRTASIEFRQKKLDLPPFPQHELEEKKRLKEKTTLKEKTGLKDQPTLEDHSLSEKNSPLEEKSSENPPGTSIEKEKESQKPIAE
ncbi:MAG: zinc-ribbon domain-containing protein [Candidatus Lokiarchaeota archaeon]|nr:zinc-ribbon domain-containing protein [Candidatus Harpocratesius repetitus]